VIPRDVKNVHLVMTITIGIPQLLVSVRGVQADRILAIMAQKGRAQSALLGELTLTSMQARIARPVLREDFL
jgi:hypothetical protein